MAGERGESSSFHKEAGDWLAVLGVMQAKL